MEMQPSQVGEREMKKPRRFMKMNVVRKPEMGMEWIQRIMKNVMMRLPSQEEPALDLGGLWYAGEKGVIVEIV